MRLQKKPGHRVHGLCSHRKLCPRLVPFNWAHYDGYARVFMVSWRVSGIYRKRKGWMPWDSRKLTDDSGLFVWFLNTVRCPHVQELNYHHYGAYTRLTTRISIRGRNQHKSGDSASTNSNLYWRNYCCELLMTALIQRWSHSMSWDHWCSVRLPWRGVSEMRRVKSNIPDFSAQFHGVISVNCSHFPWTKMGTDDRREGIRIIAEFQSNIKKPFYKQSRTIFSSYMCIGRPKRNDALNKVRNQSV